MFKSLKLKRIIKKSIIKTIEMLGKGYPQIHFYLFYGLLDLTPNNLVVWYIFKTDADLSDAMESGYSNGIEELTIRNLIASGYPEEAFELNDTGKKAVVCFASQEDIDKKANGDYRLYFQ